MGVYGIGVALGYKMKLVFASDSFKGSISSKRISELLSQAAKDVFGNCGIISSPMADGGEGTVDAVIAAVNGEMINVSVHDPLMNNIPGFRKNEGANFNREDKR